MQARSGGRVVLVTGAAGGIGRVVTAALLKDGHAVAAVDRDAEALKRLAAAHDAPDTKGRLHKVAAVQAARAHFGRIDALINNAGIGISSIRPDADARLPGIEELTADMWEPFLAIFVRAPTTITRAVVPYMKQAGWGRIINNTTSYLTMLRVLPYGAVKATFEAMSAVWAKELEGSGITVNVLVPGGPTDTALISDASGWPRDKMLKPEIMGPPAAWLVSDASAAFNGQRIIAARWDSALPPADAAAKSSRAIGWPELGADAVWLKGT
jgi:NAD(P)-dependent dehydrogenase (short-subunit alcohol dehydrogenase family)